MSFTTQQRKELTALKGIGDIFVTRLEQMGLDSVDKLAEASVDFILSAGAAITKSTCYKNSPQARKAAEEAIYWATEKLKKENVT
ncbi:recombinase RecA [Capnocytophaga canimorsus]|uniref:Recombinase RecA n=1 Tax=Capnocytophaga canimorsus TaxID=28188 RepID=A0AAC9Z1Z7_9FLAO|nr:recombinase RecA [Capnocytophaga canimorsus]ATA93003.1 recombinase RecA [Capnocytophaga canimorsus]GJQ04819.1 hypothetical protein CAPN009_12340 [Capnocytophaga canimorsus]